MRHKAAIFDVLGVLHGKTLNERGYDATGRLAFRLAVALTNVHPADSLSANRARWRDARFNTVDWGSMHEFADVAVEWHTPSAQDVDMALALLDDFVAPALERVERLVERAGSWTNAGSTRRP